MVPVTSICVMTILHIESIIRVGSFAFVAGIAGLEGRQLCDVVGQRGRDRDKAGEE